MPFSEDTKLTIKHKSHFRCCLCHELGIEVHHIVPQSEGGLNEEDNAAPLCPSCHETYGANPTKRAFIRQARDFWYELCAKRYASNTEQLESLRRVEAGLAEIQKGVQAIHSPLLPCGLFFTLHFDATDSDLDQLFKDEDGYHAFNPKQPMPPPPVGLPPGMTDGRVFWQGCYLDYRDSVLSSAGFFKQNHPGYNSIHRPVSHTISSLTTRSTIQTMKSNSPLLVLPSAKVELRFRENEKSENVKSSLSLISAPKTHEIAAVYALDNSIFVDHAVHLIPSMAGQPQNWSITDLKNSHLHVTLGLFYIENILSLQKGSWPLMHNLQIWLGPNAEKLLSFSMEQLSSQIVREDPNPIAVGQANCIQVCFEFQIDEAVYDNNILAH